MLETKEQKQYFFAVISLIVVLVVVSFWRSPSFKYNDTTDYSKVNQNILNSQAYLDYLNSVKVNKQASQDLFQTILTENDIKQEVENSLQVKQAIIPPAVDESKIKTSTANDAQAVNAYLSSSISQAYSFNTNSADLAKNLFSSNTAAQAELRPKLETLTNQLYSIPVPRDAFPLHKALLTAYLSYNNLLDAAKGFNASDYSQNDSVWPQVYKSYAIANNSTKIYTEELNKLAGKYNISYVQVNFYADASTGNRLQRLIIPEAQAFLGIGDFTFNFTLGDIPRIIMDAVKEGLRSAFLQFMGSMLNKLITKIEQNYVIANFLYYSDALLSGQYLDDYLNKYVTQNIDRQMVKKFIPQLNCGQQPQNLRPIFQAKANEYLGFDPRTVDPNDPNYYQKMASVGSFLASPSGWELYYKDLASQAQSQAEKAAEKELTSSGLKTPRDSIQSSISGSISNIISAQRASFTALLQLGINNAESLISNVVGQLTQTLVNQFVFKGVTNNGGNIAVLKEQATCVDAYQLNPVLPLPQTPYQPPSAPPTPDEAIVDQCMLLTSLSDGCTSAIISYLRFCSQTPNKSASQQSRCNSLPTSPYVRAKLEECSQLIRPTIECSQLEELLGQ